MTNQKLWIVMLHATHAITRAPSRRRNEQHTAIGLALIVVLYFATRIIASL